MSKDRPGYRPLTGIALKSAMDTIRPFLSEEVGLDLYAGSGSFGLAALKEGASHVTFVENNRTAAKSIEQSAKKHFPSSSFSILTKDVMAFLALANSSESVGVIMADPPFADWTPQFAETLIRKASGLLTPTGILLVKCPSRMLPSSEFSAALECCRKPWKISKFGESTILYFRNFRNVDENG